VKYFDTDDEVVIDVSGAHNGADVCPEGSTVTLRGRNAAIWRARVANGDPGGIVQWVDGGYHETIPGTDITRFVRDTNPR